MQIRAESGKSALPICNYSQILYQFLTFTQNLKRSRLWLFFTLQSVKDGIISCGRSVVDKFLTFFTYIYSEFPANPLILFLFLLLLALNSYNPPESNYLIRTQIFLLAHLPYLLHTVPIHCPLFYKLAIQWLRSILIAYD